MRIDLGEDEAPEIGLIALIDCIFFLLMFFMVATSFKHQDTKKREKELPIVLPASALSLQQAQALQPVVIGVDKGGKFYLDGARISSQGLREGLRRLAEKNPQQPIQIAGDRLTPYQNIVQALDLCQFEGLTSISMRTKN